VLDWFRQICLGLKYIHDRKIIHRDIKSLNIFLTAQGLIQIGDFGVAKVLQHTTQKAGTAIGTVSYMAPEILEEEPYSYSSDVWSLGVLLYEMCALKLPFEAKNLPALIRNILKGVYPPVSAYSKGL
jgi:NIMA (never in mitosis gene a)-related kinase